MAFAPDGSFIQARCAVASHLAVVGQVVGWLVVASDGSVVGLVGWLSQSQSHVVAVLFSLVVHSPPA